MVEVIDLHFLNLPEAIASFLVKTKEGPILIETGPFSTFEKLKEGIVNAGFEPEEVKHVFITHIHLDHAGAAWWFAQQGATVYMHPKGVKHMQDPSRLMHSAKRIYKDQMDTLWGEMKSINPDQVKGMEEGELVDLGNLKVQAWHTPGHAVHHVAWQIGDILFTGDVAGVKINNGPVVPPCPPPDINLEDWNRSIDKILQLPSTQIFLTHYGQVTDKNIHLEQLKSVLNDWAYWIKKKWEIGQDIQQIVPQFQEYVASQLKQAGVDDIGIQQYEAANPSWMSVSGLVRYWERKED